MWLKNCICVFLVFLCSSHNYLGFAQRTALVLSGGGTKGVAHIGVIKALEEHQIPIDFIAGTSMGAIIGGLYVNGYSPEEMEELVNSEEFKLWARGNVSEKYRFYYKQRDRDASWVTFKFNYDQAFQPRLPTSIISPNAMDFAFLEIFSGSNAVSNNDFDSLFVPFRCVAADIDSSKAYVLKKGDLGQAVRASMTFPFYFKPVVVDGRLLFDGGMYNNFPVDVALNEFHPDVIIGSKAAGNYQTPDRNDIISQISNMLMSDTDYSIDCGTSIIIEPSLPKQSVIELGNIDELIDSGYIATKNKIEEIRLFVYDSVSIEDLTEKRENYNAKKPDLNINNFVVKGLDQKQFSYVNKVLRRNQKSDGIMGKREKSQVLHLEDVKSEYFKLIADSKLDDIYPRLIYRKQASAFDLYLDIDKSNDIILDFGGNISSDPINMGFIQMQYNFWRQNNLNVLTNLYFGKFYSSAKAYGRVDFPTKIPFYLEGGYTFNRWDFFKNTTAFFEDKNPSYLVINENNLRFKAGVPARRKGKFETGVAISNRRNDYYQTNFFSRTDTADRTSVNLLTPSIKYERSSLTRKQFGNQGTFLLMGMQYHSGREKTIPGSTSADTLIQRKDHNWFTAKIEYLNHFERIGILKLGFYADLVFSNPRFFHNYTATLLMSPAFAPIPDVSAMFIPEYRASQYAGVGLMAIVSITKNFHYRIESYVFQPYQQIKYDSERKPYYADPFELRNYIASTSLVYHSFIGPLRLSLNYYDARSSPFTLSVNLGYLLFNKKGTDF